MKKESRGEEEVVEVQWEWWTWAWARAWAVGQWRAGAGAVWSVVVQWVMAANYSASFAVLPASAEI